MKDFGITIWHLVITTRFEDGDCVDEDHYFFTKRGMKKFIKKFEKQMEEENKTYSYGGETLWF